MVVSAGCVGVVPGDTTEPTSTTTHKPTYSDSCNNYFTSRHAISDRTPLVSCFPHVPLFAHILPKPAQAVAAQTIKIECQTQVWKSWISDTNDDAKLLQTLRPLSDANTRTL